MPAAERKMQFARRGIVHLADDPASLIDYRRSVIAACLEDGRRCTLGWRSRLFGVRQMFDRVRFSALLEGNASVADVFQCCVEKPGRRMCPDFGGPKRVIHGRASFCRVAFLHAGECRIQFAGQSCIERGSLSRVRCFWHPLSHYRSDSPSVKAKGYTVGSAFTYLTLFGFWWRCASKVAMRCVRHALTARSRTQRQDCKCS